MPRLPALDLRKRVNHSPHVVILGAGASRAATPRGDANGRRLPVMLDLVPVVGLEDLLADFGVESDGHDFESIYAGLVRAYPNDPRINRLEERVRRYFSSLVLPDEVTSYDILLASLREKDVVATFNWDPLLLQAYRRLSPLRSLPAVLFLHGCVAVGTCDRCRVAGYVDALCDGCRQSLKPTPLLFPTAEKDYTKNPFIRGQWEALGAALREAYFLTVFGYAAPTSDAAAVALMHEAWAQNQSRTLAEIEIIDIKQPDELAATWGPFITRQHYGCTRDIKESYLAWHPRRSCEALAFATLQLQPWPDDWIPAFGSVSELVDWYESLVLEEEALRREGVPLSGHPGSARSAE